MPPFLCPLAAALPLLTVMGCAMGSAVASQPGGLGQMDNPLPDAPYQQTQDTPDLPGPAVDYGRARAPRGFGTTAPAQRQPVGALSGRIVFTNGGHGWTADGGATNGWRLQRGLTNGINEDYGNSDQLNLFALYCFNAGAVVVPIRPIGHQTNEVVMDNDSPGITLTGSWSNSSDTVFFGSAGDVPYRFANLSAAETATATYTPAIPAAGLYPVYTWVRHGDNRGHQLYRIRHSGGESEVRLPHHMVGNGWVYLGQYYFGAGSSAANGSVLISNLRSTAQGSVVVADAIRFGNGMGSVDRGNGISNYPREDESCRYWVQASLGQGQSTTLYDTSSDDETDSWFVPPRLSVEMNRETNGIPTDRIHLSFHSNAGGGRGALGLITSNPTPNQAAFAQLCGQEINADLTSQTSPPLEVPWNNRTTFTFTGGYTEISNSNFLGEMDATILEVGFHDEVSDAKLLLDPKVRLAIAKASLHAVVRYMNTFGGGPLVFLPDSPQNPRATGNAAGSATLTWSPPISTGGSGAPTGYVLYRSTDGKGFGNPVILGNITSYTLSGLTPGTDYFFRLAATNAGGESFPSETAACRIPLPGQSTRVLLVNGFDRFDRSTNLKQPLTARTWTPPGPAGTAERVLPLRTNSFDYLIPHGQAISAFGFAYDSCTNETIADGTALPAAYPILIWAAGQESAADETFSSTEQTRLAAYRNAGGHLMVSGSEIGWDLDRDTGPTAADRAFYNNHLKADLNGNANDNSGSYTVTASPGGIFAGNAAAGIDNGASGLYRVQTPDILTAVGSGTGPALFYGGVSSAFAAIQYNGLAGGGRVVNFGFPFEAITSPLRRNELMADVLTFFTAEADAADPDLDGWTNLIEYATGTDSLIRDDTPPLTFSVTGNTLRLTVQRNPSALGIISRVQSSTDLTSWTDIASSNGIVPYMVSAAGWTLQENNATPRTVTLTDQVSLPGTTRRFLRLRVERY
jgi:Fibronectin type III domain